MPVVLKQDGTALYLGDVNVAQRPSVLLRGVSLHPTNPKPRTIQSNVVASGYACACPWVVLCMCVRVSASLQILEDEWLDEMRWRLLTVARHVQYQSTGR